jgi:hypothetical protein
LTNIIQGCNSTNDKVVTEKTAKDSLPVGDTIDIEAASVKADEYYDNLENPFDTLIGCWAAIREGNIAITFSKDSTFEFYDYNSTLKEEELLTGRIELKGSILTLFYKDRPKQRFSFKRDPESHNEYRITNSAGYYFVKSNC